MTFGIFLRLSTVVLVFSLVCLFIFFFWATLIPFFIAYMIHLFLKPFVNFFESKGLKRSFSVIFVFTTFFSFSFLILYFLIPTGINEMIQIHKNLPFYKTIFFEKIGFLEYFISAKIPFLLSLYPESDKGFEFILSSFMHKFLSGFLNKFPNYLMNIVPLFIYLLVIPFATFFFLLDERKIKHSLISHVPNKYFELSLNLIFSINRQIGWLLSGMFISAVIISILISLGLWIIDVKYPIILGVFAGISNLIPYMGPVVGIFSASLVSLMTNSPSATYIYIVVVFSIVNLLDNILIQPLVLARSANLHPLLVIFLVLFGSKFGGVMGMLFVVPLASILKVTFVIIYKELSRPIRPDFSKYIDKPFSCN